MMEVVLLSVAVIALGVSGWMLPYRWNLLRPKAIVAWMIPQRWRPAVPRVLGSVLILMGAFLLVSTAIFSLVYDDERGVPVSVANGTGQCLDMVSLEFPGGQRWVADVEPHENVTIYVKPAARGRITLVHALDEGSPTRATVPIDLSPGSMGEIQLRVGSAGIEAKDGLIRH